LDETGNTALTVRAAQHNATHQHQQIASVDHNATVTGSETQRDTAAAASTALTNVREVPRDSERSLATTRLSSVQCMTTAARDDATSCNQTLTIS